MPAVDVAGLHRQARKGPAHEFAAEEAIRRIRVEAEIEGLADGAEQEPHRPAAFGPRGERRAQHDQIIRVEDGLRRTQMHPVLIRFDEGPAGKDVGRLPLRDHIAPDAQPAHVGVRPQMDRDMLEQARQGGVGQPPARGHENDVERPQMSPQEPDGAVPAIQMAIAPFDRGHDAADHRRDRVERRHQPVGIAFDIRAAFADRRRWWLRAEIAACRAGDAAGKRR